MYPFGIVKTMKRKKRTVVRKRLVGPPPEVMDIQTLAQYLAMGRSKIYNLIRQRKIPASRIGRQYRFSKSLIDQWLTERLITRSEEPQIPLFKQGPRT
jgi:excisionase family DNA binding protein